MTAIDSTEIVAAAQRAADALLAADAVTDQAERDAQTKAFADQLAAALKVKDDAYATLQTEFTAYRLAHPDIVPPVDPAPPVEPSPTGSPDATNTGPAAGTVFKPSVGSMTISQAGTYSGLVVTGTINVTAASGVVIENSKCGGVFAENGRTVTVRNCKITGKGGGTGIQAFGIFERNDISGFENGIQVQSGKNGWAKGNYIHDPLGSTSGHYDGIALQETIDGFVIEGNAIWWKDTSDVFIKGDFGPIANVTVNANLLRIQSGQVGKTAFVVNVDGRQKKITGLKVTNNKVEKAAFGYISIDSVAGAEVSGNTDYKTGAAVN